ncbi:hypothetical protein C7R92_02980 [Brevibacillus porteri]|uniref:Uncharacterized protein n=1 Tax=Brevibacillus porteri TaxID=2126350 RepID=A0ABX5FXJ4_9BACL|nr:hypothetical protein C7R92_02980 [Brevibacillus porteri]
MAIMIRFSRDVRPDQRDDFALTNFQRDALERVNIWERRESSGEWHVIPEKANETGFLIGRLIMETVIPYLGIRRKCFFSGWWKGRKTLKW